MIIFPGCKINIGLNITEKRSDGYHNLESIFFPLNLSDILEISKSNQFSIQISGLEVNGNVNDNLIVKAYKLLTNDFDLTPVQIHLHKIVPMGAGLGGGSADGAASLVLLNQLFELNLEDQELEKYALKLGSDCPFFIANKPAYVLGTGDVLKKINLDLSSYYIQVINPNIHISTKEAFSGIIPKKINQNLIQTIDTGIRNWRDKVENDFEVEIFKKHTEIAAIKELLYSNGALYSSMTGTGSTVFGIFEHKPKSINNPAYFEWISKL